MRTIPPAWRLAALALVLCASSAAGQAPRIDGGGASARPGAEPAGKVNAAQVFLACRHSDVLSGTDATQTIRTFCERRLPAGGEWLDSAAIAAWLRNVPDTAQIRTLAEQTERHQRAAIRQLNKEPSEAEGTDISGAALAFEADSTLAAASVVLAAEITRRIREQVDSGRVAKVIVRGYPDAAGGDDISALRRARLVAGRITSDSAIAHVGVDTVVWKAPANAEPPSRFAGGVSVHLVYRLRPIQALASLGEIRFPETSATLDAADHAVLGRVVAQLRNTPLPPGQPLIVTGYAYAAPGNEAANQTLAQQRADTIRAALAQLLADQGVVPEQIVARGQVVPDPGQARRQEVRSAAITLGDGPAAAPPAAALASSSSGSGFALTLEGAASAAAEVLMERAERQVQEFVFTLAATEICSSYDDLLAQTCSLIGRTKDGVQLSFPTLRELVRQDFQALPTGLLSRALVTRAGAELTALRGMSELLPDTTPRRLADTVIWVQLPDWIRANRTAVNDWTADQVRAEFQALASGPALASDSVVSERARLVRETGGRALVALYGLHFVRRVLDGDNPVAVAARFPAWRTQQVAHAPVLAYLQDADAVRRMDRFAAFAADADSAARSLSTGLFEVASPDTVYLYALRTALVNAPDQRRSIAELASYVVQGRRQFDALRTELDSTRVRFARLADTGADGEAARRRLYASTLGEVASTFYVLVLESRLTPELRDTVAALATPVRDLMFALQEGDMRVAFTRTVAVLPRLVTAARASPWCTADEDAGCGTLALSSGTLRLAAFASDVAQAQSGDEVQEAMSRFINEGGGPVRKQTGPPATRMFVNGYAGLSGGCAWRECGSGGVSGSLHLPIGLELAWRTGDGRPGHTVSLFLRIVELSGFLPSDGQQGDRTTEEVVSSLVRPGLFVVYAPTRRGLLRSLPLSLALGGAGRAVRSGGDDPAWSWDGEVSAFIAVDIPIFP